MCTTISPISQMHMPETLSPLLTENLFSPVNWSYIWQTLMQSKFNAFIYWWNQTHTPTVNGDKR